MDRIVFISSNSHSGSTLLDMLLSSHPRIYGTGEVRALIEDSLRPRYSENAERRVCSCGSPINRCVVWSRFIDYLEQEPSGDFAVRYARLISLMEEACPDAQVLVDSSKYLQHLEQLADVVRRGALGDVELRVIHLLKDVRAYTASMKRIHGLKFWQLPQTSRKWYRSNARRQRFFREHNLPALRVGYEELCFQPGPILKRVCEFVGIDFDERMTDLRNASAHIGLGNSMRTHPEKSQQIMYDHRWFLQPDIQLCYLLSRRIRRFNERHVYSYRNGEG